MFKLGGHDVICEKDVELPPFGSKFINIAEHLMKIYQGLRTMLPILLFIQRQELPIVALLLLKKSRVKRLC